jgi:O-antigen ligase
MWKSGLSAALKKPAFGWGIHRTQVAAASELATPEMQQVVLGYNHLHNEYLTNLVAEGLPGLVSLLLMLFVPLAIFLKNSGDPELLVYNGIGSLLCIGYALSALTNQAFGDDTLNIFFVFFLAITLPGSGFTQRYPDPSNKFLL